MEGHGAGDRRASDHRGHISGRIECSGRLGRGSRQIAVGIDNGRTDGGIYGERVRGTVPGGLHLCVDLRTAVCRQRSGESEFVGLTVLQGLTDHCVARGIVVRVDRDQGIGHVLVAVPGVQRVDVSLDQGNIRQCTAGGIMEGRTALWGHGRYKSLVRDRRKAVAQHNGGQGRSGERTLRHRGNTVGDDKSGEPGLVEHARVENGRRAAYGYAGEVRSEVLQGGRCLCVRVRGSRSAHIDGIGLCGIGHGHVLIQRITDLEGLGRCKGELDLLDSDLLRLGGYCHDRKRSST